MDVHTNMQIYCEDRLLGIYDKESYCAFTEFIKKYSGVYQNFMEDRIDEYMSTLPNGVLDENSED